MNDLELTPTEDLIKELFRRPNFVGVLIHSLDDNRTQTVHTELALRSTCDDDSTRTFLELGIERMQKF